MLEQTLRILALTPPQGTLATLNPLDRALLRLVILSSLKIFTNFKKAFYFPETHLHKGANSFIKATMAQKKDRNH